MKQLLVRRGNVVIEDVPAPAVGPGAVLVRVHRSCISIGTELSGVRTSGLPLFKRALQQPEQLRKVMRAVADQGVTRAWGAVKHKLDAGSPLGYSAAGVVIAVGECVADIRVGDRVACAGSQCAFHAEVISVPRNLAVAIPDAVDFSAASTATLGAIALQGVRRAAPTLGETFVVIGLGILGQLTVQLLRANGCRTIGVDPDERRVRLAMAHGLDLALSPTDAATFEAVARLTDGIGADGAIVTASGQSDEIISSAFRVCRKKGRVVLVGDVGLDLKREDFYAKELDFLISTSYGPGRYDRRYEEEGLDYPVGYVRWTENRNLAEYLRLLAHGGVSVAHLVEAEYDLDDAPRAYESLRDGTAKPLMVLLRYPNVEHTAEPERTVHIRGSAPPRRDRIRVALIGAGGYAKAAHLPNLASLQDVFALRAVVSRSGHNATAAARQFNADYASTDVEAVLADQSVDAVIIATRHHQHAEMTLAALRAGKHVLVEKPLALAKGDVDAIDAYYDTTGAAAPLLVTGFNRRFSPYGQRLRELLARRNAPMMLSYRMNAGYLPADHWVHSAEGGGRNLGEACHIYDLFVFLVDARVTAIEAMAIAPSSAHYGRHDNFVATLRFEDGSVASLLYTALGASAHPKEQLTAYSDGRVAVLDDYRSLTFAGSDDRPLQTRTIEKGQRALLEAFGRAIRDGGEWPIPLWQQLHATDVALQIDARL